MVRTLTLASHRAWLKEYSQNGILRQWLTGLWNLIARRRGLSALVAPPPPSPEQAKAIELRRLGELRAIGARVPDVLGESPQGLILSDLGDTLSRQLKRASDAQAIDRMTAQVADDLAAIHHDGGYLGQAFPRNITVTDAVGFIDFEEDPLQVMTLREAQARDWIMFTAGVAGHYAGRTDALGRIIDQGMTHLEPEVKAIVRETASRLRFLERWPASRSSYATAIGVLRQLSPERMPAAAPEVHPLEH